MEKIIKVGEYEFAAKSTAASLFSYKANFQRDAIKDLIKLSKSINSESGEYEFGEGFELDIFFRFLWVFAKAANKEIKPFEEWLEEFEIPPFDFAIQVLPQIMEMLVSTVSGNVKPKNSPAAGAAKSQRR